MSKQFILCIAGMLLVAGGAMAQNYPSQEQFGRNRIQYRKFDWKVIKTSNFEIYFYQDGNQIANLAAQYAETDFDRITEVLGYTPYNRVKVFIYNSPQELAQSNIGLSAPSGTNYKELSLSKSRLELAFTGDQISFRKQLIKEVSLLFVYDMLYGGSLKDALQSSLLLSLPEWYMPGIASYISEGWSVGLDDYMRDVALTRPVRKPSTLVGDEATLVGHSIWNYIAERYGKDNISNILNLTRIIRNEQNSIASTLGVPYSRFLREWREFYSSMAKPVADAYRSGDDTFQVTASTLKEPALLTSLKLSPNQNYYAYGTTWRGKFEVTLVNTQTQKKHVIRKGGYKQDESPVKPSTPLVTFQRDNLLVLTEERGQTFLYIYTELDKKPKLKQRMVVRGVNQVIDMDASDDGASVVFSADRRGQNDLFLFSMGRGTVQQLTNDLYDDLYPQFVGRSRQIVFSSNRRSDSLGVDKGTYKTIQNQLSLFLHDGTPRAEAVTRLTDSLSTAMRPVAGNENTIYFLDDASGVRNLARLDVEAKSKEFVTSLGQGIRSFDLNPTSGAMVYSRLQGGNEVIGFRSRTNLSQTVQLPLTRRATVLEVPKAESASKQATPAASTTPAVKTADSTVASSLQLEPGEVDVNNYQFDSEVAKSIEYRQRRSQSTTASVSIPRTRRRENVTIRGPYKYQGLFVASDASSDWRIDPIRGFGYFQSLTMNDLLENHIIRAGLFITTNLRNSDLFAEYHKLVNRVDYSARFDRKTIFSDAGQYQKYRFNKVTVAASYPISVNSRFTVAPFYVVTRYLDLLQTGGSSSDYTGARFEYVFDNTTLSGTNMIDGTRFKLKYENYVGLTERVESGVRRGAGSFDRISLDLRHYQRLHRDFVLALRVSGSHSAGRAPKKSTLGGMENWIGISEGIKDNKPNNPLTMPANRDNRDVFFLDLAAPLRGFRLGKLTGNSYMLANAEFRLPVIRYLHRGPVTSNFLRNFQLVAFSDIGTAWSGKGPFSRQNSLNTEIVGGAGDPFQATVTNFKNPFLIGYGAGARTMLFGYYVKFDYAWGIEDNIVGKPVAYLTLGYDF
ncbi:basic secretory protein-like protein [Larkinella harenae]